MSALGLRAVRKWVVRGREVVQRLATAEELWGDVSLHSPLLQSANAKLFEPNLLLWPSATVGDSPEHLEAANAVVEAAVDRAEAALSCTRPPAWRASVLGLMAKKMEESTVAEELAQVECWSSGKPITQARDDVTEAVKCLRHFSSMCSDYASPWGTPRVTAGYEATDTYVRNDPIGVCAAIVPFNFPLLIASWKLAPAIAFGNALLVKPSEYTPLSAMVLQSIFGEAVEEVEDTTSAAEVARDLVQVVPGGREIGEALCRSNRVGHIAFTGSTAAGRKVQAAVAAADEETSPIRRCTLELGGNAPAIICADADLELAVEQIYHGLFMNAGQNCCAVGRIFLQEEISLRFLEALQERISREVRVGDPFDEQTTLGPMVSTGHAYRIKKLLDETASDGIGVSLPCADEVSYSIPGITEDSDDITVPVYDDEHGFNADDGEEELDVVPPSGPHFDTCFVKPTLHINVPDGSPLGETEVFGPIARVMIPFQDIGEAVSRANSTEFGLAGGVFTQDMDLAASVANQLDCGNVWVNTWNWAPVQAPFAGRKASGQGSNLGVEEARAAWSHPKQITLPKQQ